MLAFQTNLLVFMNYLLKENPGINNCKELTSPDYCSHLFQVEYASYSVFYILL